MDDHSKSKEQLIDELAGLRLELNAFKKNNAEAGNSDTGLSGHNNNEGNLTAMEIFTRTLENQIRDTIFTLSLQGTIISLNLAFENITGWQVQEWIGKPFTDLIHPEDIPISMERFSNLLKGNIHGSTEVRVRKKSGGYIYSDILISPIMRQGRIFEILGIGRDITDRKLVLENLRESEATFSRVFIKSPVAMILTLPDEGTIFDVNEIFLGELGYTRDEVIGHTVAELGLFVDPDDRLQLNQILKDQGTVSNFECRFRSKNWRILYGLVSVVFIKQEGRICQLSTIIDITGRKLIEHKAGERMKVLQVLNSLSGITEQENFSLEEIYQEFVNILPDAYQYSDITCARIVINDNEFRTKNFAESEWSQSASIQMRGSWLGWIEVGYLGERPTEEEGPFLKEERMLLDTVSERLGLITEQKHVGLELYKLRKAIDRSADAVFMTNPEGIITFVNPGYTKTYGYSAAEVVGKATPHILKSGYVKTSVYDNFWASLLSRQEVKGEYKNKRKDGIIIDVEGSANAILDEKGTIIGFLGIQRDITERRQAEDKLKKSEEKYRVLVENTDTGFVVTDEQGKVISANEPYRKLAGFEINEYIIGRSVIEWTAPDEKENNANAVSLCALQGFVNDFETIYQHSNGTRLNIAVNASVYKSPEGFNQIVCYCRDITERKLAELALKESEGKYMALFESNTDGITIFQLTGDELPTIILDMNTGAHNMLGYTKEEMLVTNPQSLEKDFTAEIADKRIQDLKARGYSDFGTKLRHKDGHYIPVEIKVLIINYNHRPALMNIVRDITWRKLAEAEQKESEEKFKTLFNTAGDAIFTMNQTTFLDCNTITEKIFKCSREQIVGHSPVEFSPERQPDGRLSSTSAMEKIEAAFAGQPQVFEWLHTHLDGTPFYADVSLNRVFIGGQFILQSIVRDINERKLAEDERLKSESKLKEAQELAKIGNWELDLIQNKLFWSDEIFRIFGCSPQQFDSTYETFLSFIHPDDRDFVNDSYNEHLRTKKPYNINHRILLANGKIKYVNERCRSEFDDNDQPIRSIGTVADITEQKIIENEITIAKEKAEESNRLKIAFLNNMSHEIRTPLNAIAGFSDLMAEPGQSPETLAAFSRMISTNSDKLIGIISNVIEISKIQSNQIEINLSEIEIVSFSGTCRIVLLHLQKKKVLASRSM